MKKRAIVTGATGFIGSNLCEKLLEDFNVYIIVRKNSDYSNVAHIKSDLNVFEYDGDLKELVEFFEETKADVVFHLASKIVEHNIENIADIVSSNITFGSHILEAMRLTDTELIINTGTFWQYYNGENYSPVNFYASTKEAFQNILTLYVQAYNIRAINLMLYDVYSELDNRNKIFTLFNKYANNGEILNLSKGEQYLDCVYIDDVCKAFICAYNYLVENNNVVNEQFEVVTNEQHTLIELVEIFEQETGKKLNVNFGGLPYRERQIMKPSTPFDRLPNWEAKVNIKEGLAKYKNI